jgi:hypothetical protein
MKTRRKRRRLLKHRKREQEAMKTNRRLMENKGKPPILIKKTNANFTFLVRSRSFKRFHEALAVNPL